MFNNNTERTFQSKAAKVKMLLYSQERAVAALGTTFGLLLLSVISKFVINSISSYWM